MGRHGDSNGASFYASLGRAMLRGLLALVLSFGLYTVLANIRDGGHQPPPTVARQAGEAPPERAAHTPPPAWDLPAQGLPTQDLPTRDTTSWATPSPAPGATPNADLVAVAPTTVQVLDGGAGRQRTDEAVAALKALGYEVVAVNKAVRAYKVTTVFYSVGQGESAQKLRARDQRFAEIDESSNLDQRVALHVVVGTDWRS